jgi:hypothetical protein
MQFFRIATHGLFMALREYSSVRRGITLKVSRSGESQIRAF